MYPNFNAERARKGITLETIAEKMGKTIGTISLKLSGQSIITVDEAKQLKEILGTKLPLETLFSTEPIEE
jgi:transcriptional regulator with XRE-family HTH domain